MAHDKASGTGAAQLDREITTTTNQIEAAPPRVPVEIRRFTQSFVQFSIIAIFVMALGITLQLGRYVFAPMVAGVLVGFTFGPISGWLERRGVPPTLASAGIVVGSGAVVFGLLVGLAVPLEEWSSRVPEITRAVERHWEKVRGPIEQLKQVEDQVSKAADSDRVQPMEVTVQTPGIITDLISSASDVVARLLIFVATFYFFLATRTNLKRSGLAFLPTRNLQFSFARILRDTESYLSRYVATITLINIGLGVVVAVVMYLIGIPQAYMWGAIATVLNYAMYVGPAVMTIILLGVGLLTFPDSFMALAPAIAYVAINGLEGQFVTPAILGGRLTLNPLVVFVAITFWLWLWGPIGAFLAVPILIIGTMTLYHLVPNTRRKSTVLVDVRRTPRRSRRRVVKRI